ncbi:MAG: DUF3667 domain-containing protein [Burkholderiaceae bacterium]|nr:DUF3667 domain-containing protein [Burkholderiaceae bacterium]
MSDAPSRTHCANCGQPLPQPPLPFCGHCGQETRLRAPTLVEFLQQFGGAYLSTEGALWRSLKLLLLKPGALTVEYLRGRRRHYVLPLRLYLTISVLVLLAMRLMAHVDLNIDDVRSKIDGKPRQMQMDMLGGKAGLRDGQFYCHDLPAWLCARLKARLDVSPETLVRQASGLGERFVGNLGTAMFVLLPSFALWLKLAYWNRRLRYTEHLITALHLHAFWFLMMGLMLSGQAWLLVPALLAIPVYGWLALGRVYQDRRRWRLPRVLLIGTAQATALSLAMAGLGLYTLLA